MQEMKDFVIWFVEYFPQILLTPPISAFTGIVLLFFTAALVSRLLKL